MLKQHSSGYLNLKLPPRDPKKLALFGPRELKTPGSEEWIIQTLFHANGIWHSLAYDTKKWQDVVAELDQQQVWLKYPKEKPYGTRAALYMEELGADEPVLTQAKEEQQLRAKAGAPEGNQNAAKNKPDNVRIVSEAQSYGNSAAYIRARLERDGKTELLARIQRGEISAHRAAIEAGFRQQIRAASDEWYTPDFIVQRVIQVFGGEIDLDPCAPADPNIPAKAFFTRESDGLNQRWIGKVFVNPPYQQIQIWVEKLVHEYREGNTIAAIALLPSWTDRPWFQMLHDHPVCFLAKRLKFSESGDNAPFASCVVYLGDDIKRFAAAFADIGGVWVQWVEQPPAEGR
jgi:phage N-6-adenine-methyltransferase